MKQTINVPVEPVVPPTREVTLTHILLHNGELLGAFTSSSSAEITRDARKMYFGANIASYKIVEL